MRIRNVLEYLEATSARLPEKVAFSDGIGKESLCFEALHKTTCCIGSALLSRGMRGHRVAILMERHPSAIAAMLGVWYAGACSVMPDTAMPDKRLDEVLSRAEVSLLIVDDKHAPLAARLEIPSVSYGTLASHTVDTAALADVRRRQIDTDPIYIVFTSGSTGAPKGVIGCHRAVIDYAEALLPAIGISEESVLGCQSPLFFDAPLKEILSTIVMGATTYLIPRTAFAFPMQLLQYLREQEINTVCWVSSAFLNVSALGALGKYPPSSLRTVVFGSEVFPRAHYDRWRAALPQATFYQLYGPTEATGMSCVWRADRALEAGEPIPIGAPLCNTDAFLVSEQGERILPSEGAASEQGEIYLRGTCLTLGYDHAPSESEAVFVQNPLHDAYCELVYRTGDMAYYNAHGELVFVGRRDAQIKLQGHRIEPGAIEVAAMAVDGVTRACCVYPAIARELVLFYTGTCEPEELRRALAATLLPYMLPRRIIKKTMLPETPNGKPNRRALLEQAMRLQTGKEDM